MENKFLPKKIMDILKKQGFHCPGFGKIFYQRDGFGYVYIDQPTPSGDEWRIKIWFDEHLESFQQGVEACANIFDVDDEVERLIPCRGEDGHPRSIQTLLDDAKWKKRKLQELSMALKAGLKSKETSKSQEMKKYRVYGNYIFSKYFGEIEAASPEEAVQKAIDNAPQKVCLCVNCAKEFVDPGVLDEDSVVLIPCQVDSSNLPNIHSLLNSDNPHIQALINDTWEKQSSTKEASKTLKQDTVTKKYKAFGNYVFSKSLGEVEAVSSETAVKQAIDEAPQKACLCVNCAREFVDSGVLYKESVTVEETIS